MVKCRVRLKYVKGEQVKYISHLDMLKVFTRATRRAHISVSYSEGFNPHPQFVFGQPLPVGVTSLAEYVDIALDEEPGTLISVKDRLNSVLPDGIEILDEKLLDDSDKNIMKSVVSSEYILSIRCEEEFWSNEIIHIYKSGLPLEAEKKGKSTTAIVDIRPMILDMKILSLNGSEASIYLKAVSGNETNIRAELAVDALFKEAYKGSEMVYEILDICKTSLNYQE